MEIRQTMLWLRWFHANLSQQRPGLDPRLVCMGFVVDRVALGWAFLQVLWLSKSVSSYLSYNFRIRRRTLVMMVTPNIGAGWSKTDLFLYKTVMKLTLCLQELEEFCFKFSLNHMTAIIETEGFASLDEQMVKSFIRKAAKFGAFRS